MKNSTIKKLDRFEIAELGMYDLGIYTFKGDLKSRVKGFKTTLRTDDETHFEGEDFRVEVIKIVATNNEGINEYAIRVFSEERAEYLKSWPIINGCNFFR